MRKHTQKAILAALLLSPTLQTEAKTIDIDGLI